MRLAVDLDLADLPAEDALQLTRLVQAARLALTDAPPSKPRPDRFVYELRFEAPEWGRETHALCEPEVPEPVRPLIERLTDIARRGRA
jgi:hypothetical protein